MAGESGAHSPVHVLVNITYHYKIVYICVSGKVIVGYLPCFHGNCSISRLLVLREGSGPTMGLDQCSSGPILYYTSAVGLPSFWQHCSWDFNYRTGMTCILALLVILVPIK